MSRLLEAPDQIVAPPLLERCQNRRFRFECLCQPADVHECNVALAPLDPTQIPARRKARKQSQSGYGLAKTMRGSQSEGIGLAQDYCVVVNLIAFSL